jgi:pimeloyl-ACP methyl ester carboxylesterase
MQNVMNAAPRALILVGVSLAALRTFAAAASEPSADPSGTLTRSWVDHERYSGRPGSLPSTPVDFRQLACELQAARSVRTDARLPITQRTPYETVRTPRNNLGKRIPLSLIHWKRALEVVTPEQQRQALSTGVEPEPILTNVTILAVAPIRATTYRGASVDLSLAAADFFEETGTTNTIRSLRINPGDGTGWRDLTIGQDVTAAYDTTGPKTLTVEAALVDGTVLTASSVLKVAALTTPDPTASISLTAAAPYDTVTGTLYIYKSAGTNAGLRCPVLVAEGFDMDNSMDWDVLYNLLNKEQLAETLRSYGRDLIVLDYTDAMRNIFENAALARAAVEYVNANRSNAADKFTVIGASMGGLVTRIALADMDRDPALYGISGVDSWISFDSPHSGANIPLGIQEFLDFFYDKDSSFAAAEELLTILNQPAAKQMLLVHHSKTTSLAGNSSNITFQAALDAIGYPASCKNIAVSNGSGYGDRLPFSEGVRVINWSYRSFLVDIDGRIYALSTTSTPAVPTVFYGFWDTLWPFDETSTTRRRYYHYALDNSPGGTRDSFQVLFDSTESFRGSGDYCLWPDHCFIPTVSSLGIDMAFCSDSLNANPAIAASSPFDEIHYAADNEEHIDINESNRRWFIRAVMEDYDTDGDGYDDYQEHLVGTVYDSPASKLEGPTMQAQVFEPGAIDLSWNWTTNVNYTVYYTGNLAGEWILAPAGSFYQTPPTAGCRLPTDTPAGFYKIYADVNDPVTD